MRVWLYALIRMCGSISTYAYMRICMYFMHLFYFIHMLYDFTELKVLSNDFLKTI